MVMVKICYRNRCTKISLVDVSSTFFGGKLCYVPDFYPRSRGNTQGLKSRFAMNFLFTSFGGHSLIPLLLTNFSVCDRVGRMGLLGWKCLYLSLTEFGI